ncbi:MAG: membrane protein insertion efficiency factor YidD, partial [Bifidobacteriaceae bacterium]|nr:membrane protein insertion efficiency factor YidD [Bifidobacteriaceae bacterium]
MKTILLGMLGGYQQLISPLFGGRCRYYPSCSEYAKVAITKFGALRGTFLAIDRLLRCVPFSDGGIDEVPNLYVGAVTEDVTQIEHMTSSKRVLFFRFGGFKNATSVNQECMR